MRRPLKPNPIPPEMQKKLDELGRMDVLELGEAYKKKLDEMGLPFPSQFPTLDLIYKLLIPELFELAQKVNREKGLDRAGKNVLETIAAK